MLNGTKLKMVWPLVEHAYDKTDATCDYLETLILEVSGYSLEICAHQLKVQPRRNQNT